MYKAIRGPYSDKNSPSGSKQANTYKNNSSSTTTRPANKAEYKHIISLQNSFNNTCAQHIGYTTDVKDISCRQSTENIGYSIRAIDSPCMLVCMSKVFIVSFCFSARQARIPSRLRPESCRTRSAQRGVRHRQSSAVRLSGATDQTEDSTRQAVQRPPERRSFASVARLRMDARGLRQRIHFTSE